MDLNDFDNTDTNGLIQRIQVKNFFCHDNFIVDFSENNVHWVIGRNGSGKSAILTALIVGLGGKAAATNRGNNFQTFIKRGSTFATIEIRIKNSADNSYNHDVYGDHITVTRRITTAGVSNYTVKAASGEVVSTRFAEVNNIKLALEIQVDNPISVLNQDEARSFFSIDSKKLYSLFRRATNLDHSERNYQRIKENCQKAIETKKEKQKTCEQLKKKYEEWEKKYSRLNSHAEMKKQLRALKNEIAWRAIQDLQNKRNTLKEKINSQKRKCLKISESIMNMEQENGNYRSSIEALKMNLEECNRAKTSLEQEKNKMDKELRDAEEELRNAQRATGKKRERLEKEMRKVANFEQEIGNIESGGAAQRREALQREAEDARAQEAALAAGASSAEQLAEQARAQRERASAALDALEADERDAKRRLGELRRRQDDITSREGNPLAVWGAKMVELRRRIDMAVERNQFSEPPVGPIGYYLRVKDPKWADALEHIIGSTKTTFCVNNVADSKKLFQIMGEVFGDAAKPGVACARFLRERHDVSRRRARGPLCALDALLAPQPVVANFLIDSLALETVLLVPDLVSASALTSRAANVPANCAKVVTQDCREFYPAPNYRSYARAAGRPRHGYLQQSTEDVERGLREEAAQAERALGELAARAAAARRELEAARRTLERAEGELRARLAARHDAAARRAAAERALARRSPQHDELEKELDVSKRNVENLKAQVEEAETLENSHDQKVKEYKIRITQIKAELHNATTSARNLSEEIVKKQFNIDKEATRKQNYERILEEEQTSIATMEEEMAGMEAALKEKVQQALKNGEKVENPRDRETLKGLIEATTKEMSAVDRMQLDVDEVREETERARTEFENLRDLLAQIDELILQIDSANNTRIKFYYRLVKQITRRVQKCFLSNLAIHGYNGLIEVRHAAGQLALSLRGRGGAARPAEALSGGERSYCTVALLLAFWGCVELPFYFLDEFDVFLDPDNRQIVVELLLDFARRRSSRQFVLLSPHAHALLRTANVQTHQLADPRS